MSDILLQIEGLDDLADLADLELLRCTSNPLRRNYSNISCESQEGATFVPLGRIATDDSLPTDYFPQQPACRAGPAPSMIPRDRSCNNPHVDVEVDSSRLFPSPTQAMQPLNPAKIAGLAPNFFLNRFPGCFIPHAQNNTPTPTITNNNTPPGLVRVPPVKPYTFTNTTHPSSPYPQDSPVISIPPSQVSADASTASFNSIHLQNIALPAQSTQPQQTQPTATNIAGELTPPVTQTGFQPHTPVQHQQHQQQQQDFRWLPVSELIRRNVSLHSLLDQNLISRLFRDQNGSRYIQDKLNEINLSTEQHTVLDDILEHLVFNTSDLLNLSQDVYGNYVMQILFQIGTSSHHDVLFTHLLKNNVCRLTHSFYGCRVIQAALDWLPKAQIMELVGELDNKAIHDCIIGQNSNHVIQKVLSCHMPMQRIQFIIECVTKRLYFYATHIFGCRIVQCMVKYYSGCAVLPAIVSKQKLIVSLSRSEYGNYVVQDIVELPEQHAARVSVFENVVVLSKNKFGSNVVEKCLVCCSDEERDVLMERLTVDEASGLVEMVKDKYANYVIQKLLVSANHKQQSKLIYLIEKYVPNVLKLSYGKYISDKIKQIKNRFAGAEEHGNGKRRFPRNRSKKNNNRVNRR